MNWKELRTFIDTLGDDQLNEDVAIIDTTNGTSCYLIEAEISDSLLYVTYQSGIVKESDMEGWVEEEIEDVQNDAYFTIDPNTPYLTIE